MNSVFISYGEASIRCLRFGQGPELLVALHGYGDRADMFAAFEARFGARFTLVAIDLPFHGKTRWPGHTFQRQDITGIIRKVMETEGRPRLSLMGFSFGARLVLAVLPDFLPLTDRLILLSPDGIDTRGMRLALRTPMAVRRFLYRALERPHGLLRLLRFGHKLRIIPSLYFNFLVLNLARADRYRRIFACWFALNTLNLSLPAIRNDLLHSGIPVDIFIGVRDNRLRLKPLKKFAAGIPGATLTVLDAGHDLI